jgi:hypothetical protein
MFKLENTFLPVPSNTYAVYKLKGPHTHQGTTECICSSYMLVCLAAVRSISLEILRKITITSKVVGIFKGHFKNYYGSRFSAFEGNTVCSLLSIEKLLRTGSSRLSCGEQR